MSVVLKANTCVGTGHIEATFHWMQLHLREMHFYYLSDLIDNLGKQHDKCLFLLHGAVYTNQKLQLSILIKNI